MLGAFLKLSFRAQAQYPASFALLCLSHFVSTALDMAGIWILFDRFALIDGWTLPELALVYGIIHMGFAIAEGFARGFDLFGHMVKTGDFDRVLLRPLSPLFQIAVQDLQFMRLGRFLQGLAVLLWGAITLSLPLWAAPFILLSIGGTLCLFYGIFVIQGALSFWTTESLEVMNIATYGGVQAGQYPLSIYPRPFRLALLPLACVGYYPIATLLQQESLPLWIAALAPLAGLAVLLFSFLFWEVGVRHYRSSGS